MINAHNTISANDMEWKPIYPNNMKCNGVDGYYCLIVRQHKDEAYYGRKYSIIFQHKEIEPGTGYINTSEIDRYVLFEKAYPMIVGRLDYPEPSDDSFGHFNNSCDTLSDYDVNDYGGFVYAYETLELAKKRAEVQWNHIYGYVASFINDQ